MPWASFALVALVALVGLLGPLAGCVAPTPDRGCEKAGPLQPLVWSPYPALDGPLDDVARRIVTALGDEVTDPEGHATVPALWLTRNGTLQVMAREAEKTWLYKVTWKWPADEEEAARLELQARLDRLAPNLWAVEARDFNDDHLVLQRFPGTEYAVWAGSWHFEQVEGYHASTLELRPLRAYAETPQPLPALVGSAQAFVDCRAEATGTAWALPLMRVDEANLRGLQDDAGRLRLYVPWQWVAGTPPAGCPELALYGIQVDATTGAVVHAQEPAGLALCAAPNGATPGTP